MRVAVLCEYSGVVRDAFIAAGHDAISCDLLPTERPGPHYRGSVHHFLCDSRYSLGFDLIVAHPPCTRLCNSGVLRLYKNGKKENGIDPAKWAEMEAAAHFFKALLYSNAEMVCIENPVPHGYALERIGKKYTQIIQPYNFGEDASKATCLWLKGLPILKNTGYCEPRIVDGKKRWSNQTDSGQNKLPPSETRAKDRAKTYVGIAKAMAEQWGKSNIVDMQLKLAI